MSSTAINPLDEILARLNALPESERKRILEDAMAVTAEYRWTPNPGPQTDAYFSEADELFYGGQAGGGKTDLEIGLALTAHTRSLLLRRTNKEANGIVVRMADIIGSRTGWNGQDDFWRLDEDRIIDIGGCQLEDDKQKYKGTPHDLICFDEVSDFSETQYRFICGWNRSTKPGQRCRVVAAGNPPTRPEGLWVVRRWAAWLDPRHPNPAKPGELRWYVEDENGNDIEVEGRGPHLIGGREILARSRTFIPAKLSDNPDLARTDYGAVLDNLPKELRDAYRDGKFRMILEDGAFQAIPTEWVMQAIARWQATGGRPPSGVPMSCIALDPAQVTDNSALAMRHSHWYDLKKVPGKETALGKQAAAFIHQHRRDNCQIVVDMSGGYGGPVNEVLMNNGLTPIAHKGAEKSKRRTKDRKLTFANKRTQVYWQLREALDPDQPGGSKIALPDDARMIAGLCAPTFEVVGTGIKLEPKENVVKRLGFSPDEADAITMAHAYGPSETDLDTAGRPDAVGANHGRRPEPKVIMGHPMMRRNYGRSR
jgi:hypothetical protein